MEISTVNNCLSDLWNFHLVLIGISVSIFVLLYSFILNKRDELKTISEQIKNGDKNPTLVQKERFAIKYISRLKKFNTNILCVFIVSTFLCFWSWVTLRIINDTHTCIKQWFIIIIGVLTVFLCLYVAIQFFKIYRHYNSETKV
jgi:RsiW-degrading membrane proteinase PrsW (M82 family)